MDPSPVRPTLDAIRDARAVLAGHLGPTRLVAAPSLSRRAGAEVFLKLECELPTGSFKPRGALYALAASLRRGAVREVVASSTGNHGAAVAWAARRLGVPARIFLPERPNPVKRRAIADLGAAIVEGGRDLAEAYRLAAAHAREAGALLLDDATHPDVPAGTATIGCEVLEQRPDVDAVIVPMGDSALVRGIAAARRHLGRDVRVVAVQAERAPAYYLSWRAGKVVTTDSCDTIADGLATRTPDARNVEDLRALVDDVRLVSEDELLGAMRLLALEERVEAEPAGAAATAALLALSRAPGRSVVVLVTGRNAAPEVMERALRR